MLVPRELCSLGAVLFPNRVSVAVKKMMCSQHLSTILTIRKYQWNNAYPVVNGIYAPVLIHHFWAAVEVRRARNSVNQVFSKLHTDLFRRHLRAQGPLRSLPYQVPRPAPHSRCQPRQLGLPRHSCRLDHPRQILVRRVHYPQLLLALFLAPRPTASAHQHQTTLLPLNLLHLNQYQL